MFLFNLTQQLCKMNEKVELSALPVAVESLVYSHIGDRVVGIFHSDILVGIAIPVNMSYSSLNDFIYGTTILYDKKKRIKNNKKNAIKI